MILRATSDGKFRYGDVYVRCALGKGGVIHATAKREGDGASPIGEWSIRRVLWRADRGPIPETALPVAPIARDDGWCDAPDDRAYNRIVKHPYPASAERLWRDDHAYDIVVVLGYNDAPVRPGAGSAIFWHLAQPDWRPTEGCVAITEADMRAALKSVRAGDALEIDRA
ncbi:MAG: L,D-transpeptidase family protein [Alphaproteobacteria bacterium]|nr:L,D-transpeptidase family protein [Alphaproteobacteria bacterium]